MSNADERIQRHRALRRIAAVQRLTEDVIEALLAIPADRKIFAIQELRRLTGCDLADAKWLVENHDELAQRFNPSKEFHSMLKQIETLERGALQIGGTDRGALQRWREAATPPVVLELCRLARIAIILGHGR